MPRCPMEEHGTFLHNLSRRTFPGRPHDALQPPTPPPGYFFVKDCVFPVAARRDLRVAVKAGARQMIAGVAAGGPLSLFPVAVPGLENPPTDEGHRALDVEG